MEQQSIPDQAASLLLKREDAMRAVRGLVSVTERRHSFLELAVEEAVSGASAAMQSAWRTLDRLQAVAEELAKHEAEKREQ